ncbi:MAG: DUF3369 domain-containing protein, partial [Azoarcus sp.]|nr:DUF3369 domain-containing protein [Azoarcus sp.]
IEQNRRGLEQIIIASASIFQIQALERFVQGVLTQLVSLLRLGDDAFCCGSGCYAVNNMYADPLRIVAGTGAYAGHAGEVVERVLSSAVLDDVNCAVEEQHNVFADGHLVLFFENGSGQTSVIYLECDRELSPFEKDLLNIFCTNVAVAFDNINLTLELERTQKEVVERIGAVAETRSEETGNHVKRVAEYCCLLARAFNLGESEAQTLKEAAPMHDIGKVGIPDSILNKPGKLDTVEFEIMKRHAEIGFKLLSGSKSRLLDISAVIAREHHERYDGTGYPRGLKGNEISLYGRITAIADVFDALGSPRCYKAAWPIDEVFAYMEAQRGKQFDPELIDLFMAHKEEILQIRESFKD